MVFIVAILLVLASIWLGLRWTKGKSDKRKWIVWGLMFILGMGPSLSWLTGIGWGVVVGDGFAGMGMMIFTYAGFFVIGLIAVVIGLLKKD